MAQRERDILEHAVHKVAEQAALVLRHAHQVPLVVVADDNHEGRLEGVARLD
jgi:hypothetical protein